MIVSVGKVCMCFTCIFKRELNELRHDPAAQLEMAKGKLLQVKMQAAAGVPAHQISGNRDLTVLYITNVIEAYIKSAETEIAEQAA